MMSRGGSVNPFGGALPARQGSMAAEFGRGGPPGMAMGSRGGASLPACRFHWAGLCRAEAPSRASARFWCTWLWPLGLRPEADSVLRKWQVRVHGMLGSAVRRAVCASSLRAGQLLYHT